MKKRLQPKHMLVIILLLLVLGGLLFSALQNAKRREQHVDYKDFYELIEQGNITDVTFLGDTLAFHQKDREETFYTDNPDSIGLKEYLLMNRVEVKKGTNGADILYTLLDLMLYAVIFGGILLLAKRFVGKGSFKMIPAGKATQPVTFDRVIGMDAIKQELMQMVEILKHEEDYAAKGIRMPKGILLEGAPGNGKTLLARAIATEAKVNFIPTKATDFESMFMAIGPAKIKQLFRYARRHTPCVVFIDEFDGIGTRRNYNGNGVETENTRIVTALLNELDGFTVNHGVLVIAATNSKAALDEALVRPGRFDRHYLVPYPEEADRIRLVELYTENKKLADGLTAEWLGKAFHGSSAARIEAVLNQAALVAARQQHEAITQEDFLAAVKML